MGSGVAFKGHFGSLGLSTQLGISRGCWVSKTEGRGLYCGVTSRMGFSVVVVRRETVVVLCIGRLVVTFDLSCPSHVLGQPPAQMSTLHVKNTSLRVGNRKAVMLE